MKDFHARHRGQEVTTAQFLAAARESLGRDVEADLRPWLDRTGVPDPAPAVDVLPQGKEWRVTVRATQPAGAYRLATTVAVEAGDQRFLFPMTVEGAKGEAAFTVPEKPRRVVFDALADFPVATDRHYAFGSFAEDFDEDADRLRHRAGRSRRTTRSPCASSRSWPTASRRPCRPSSRTPRWTRPSSPRTTSSCSATRATTRSSRGVLPKLPVEVGAGLLPVPGSDVRRRARRPLPRPAEPLRAGARAARPPRQQPAPAVRDDEDLPRRDCRRGRSSGARRSRRRGTSRSSASLSR